MELPVRDVPTPLIGPPLESPNMPWSLLPAEPVEPDVPLVQACAPLKPLARPPALTVLQPPEVPGAAPVVVLPGVDSPGVVAPGVELPEVMPAAEPRPATSPASSWPKN